jgi:hypothetical protein
LGRKGGFGRITTTFTTIIQKGHSFVRSFIKEDTHTHTLTELIYRIWNPDNFSKQNVKSSKISTL